MAEYEYKGPHPVAGDDGVLVHPGDVREFGAEPDCPPWRPLEEPEPASPSPAPADITPAAPAASPEGM